MRNRTRYIIGNWKMNTSLAEARTLLDAVAVPESGVQVGIAPPYPWIVPLHDGRADDELWIGAQHAVPQVSGAFTGDVSVALLEPYVDFVLIGHSEQRQFHTVESGVYATTVEATLSVGKTAILCVGEDSTARNKGQAEDVVIEQLRDGVPNVELTHLIVAYEPVWAIGTGQAATATDAQAMASFIEGWFQRELGISVPVLYGGSVSAANAADFLAEASVSGLLVGSASLNGVSFNCIIETAALAAGGHLPLH